MILVGRGSHNKIRGRGRRLIDQSMHHVNTMEEEASFSSQEQRSVVRLSPLALFAILVGCAAASFGAGRILQSSSTVMILTRHENEALIEPKKDEEDRTRYISDHFDETHEVHSYSLWDEGNGTCADATAPTPSVKKVTTDGPATSPTVKQAESSTIDDSLLQTLTHEPVGQQLLMDLDQVDSAFLDSEDRLARAIIALVAEHPSVKLLSYHCHGMHPAGVSCVGVLSPGGAVTFHTWPDEGVITLDMLVTGSSCSTFSLLRLLDKAQSLFGVPANDNDGSSPSQMVWALKRRGFRTAEHDTYNPEDDEQWVLSVANRNDKKALVASIQTPFQSVDIFDVTEGRFDVTEGRFGVDRMVFLDRILQSSRFGEAAYHEALVHPALFAHDRPKRVVIIGGGEGATLREVLKHKTVEEAIMVEIDEMMVNVSREYLPEWSDCSNLLGSADSCFDDPRASVYYEDAIQWFIDRYGGNSTVAEEELIDVIIMDALDPTSFVEFSDLLYDSELLMRAFSNALGEEGILVSQFGEADEVGKLILRLRDVETTFCSLTHPCLARR